MDERRSQGILGNLSPHAFRFGDMAGSRPDSGCGDRSRGIGAAGYPPGSIEPDGCHNLAGLHGVSTKPPSSRTGHPPQDNSHDRGNAS